MRAKQKALELVFVLKCKILHFLQKHESQIRNTCGFKLYHRNTKI